MKSGGFYLVFSVRQRCLLALSLGLLSPGQLAATENPIASVQPDNSPRSSVLFSDINSRADNSQQLDSDADDAYMGWLEGVEHSPGEPLVFNFSPSQGLLSHLLEGVDETDTGLNWQMGANLDRWAGPGQSWTMQLLQSVSGSGMEQGPQNTDAEVSWVAADKDQSERSTGESIASFQLLDDNGWLGTVRSGVEAAYNFFEERQRYDSAELAGGRSSEMDVSELRLSSDFFASWLLEPGLSVDAGAEIEYSEISFAAQVEESRQYTHPKPRLELSYEPDGGDLWSLSVRRQIDHLKLSDFTSIVRQHLDVLGTTATQLEPEKSWVFSSEYQHSLSQDKGLLSLGAFYHRIDDVIDQQPVAGNQAIKGNIGSADRYGLRLESDYYLQANTQLNAYLLLQDSEVQDPFTGELRDLTGFSKQHVKLSMSHDFNRLPLNTGLSYSWRSEHESHYIDKINEVSQSDGWLDTYFEYKVNRLFNLRLDIRNLLDSRIETRRFLFDDGLSSGAVSSIEDDYREFGRTWELSISGQI